MYNPVMDFFGISDCFSKESHTLKGKQFIIKAIN